MKYLTRVRFDFGNVRAYGHGSTISENNKWCCYIYMTAGDIALSISPSTLMRCEVEKDKFEASYPPTHSLPICTLEMYPKTQYQTVTIGIISIIPHLRLISRYGEYTDVIIYAYCINALYI